MPRWALVSLLAAFIVPGLFGHELWPQDATGFARMWSMAHGAAGHWLFPDIAGVPAVRDGPLPYWFGAALIRCFGGRFGETNAAAAANLFWYPLAIVALWQAVSRLARRDEALPVAGAFGGDASRRDYSRLVADIALLLAIGTIGVVLRLHQTHADAAAMAAVSVALLALSAIEWHRGLAAVLAGAAVGAAALIQGPILASGLLLGCILVFLGGQAAPAAEEATRAGANDTLGTANAGAGDARTYPPASVRVGLALLVLAVGAGIAAAWPVLGFHFFPRQAASFFAAWEHANFAPDSLPLASPRSAAHAGAWLLRTGVWFLWPLWPLAAWAVYAWRGSLRAPHLERPLLLLISIAAAMMASAPLDERALVDLIPPLVVLAAFGATTLRRALDNAIDWLAIAFFSLVLLFLWAYYAAMDLGVPHAMASSVARLAPGFRAEATLSTLVPAALVAVFWIYLIFWRVVRRPQVLWRGPMLAAAGVVAAWTTANLLYLPAVDYIFGYRSFSVGLATELRTRGWTGHGCVDAIHVPLAERAIVAYYGRIPFRRDGESAADCRFALQYVPHGRAAVDLPPFVGLGAAWHPVWEGRRRPRPQEIWRIWERAP